ncbi:MAG: hypothetical protein ACK56W_16925 [Pirellula sp.]|jgi:hypothetical protein
MKVFLFLVIGIMAIPQVNAQDPPSIPSMPRVSSPRTVTFQGKRFPVDEYLQNPIALDYEREQWVKQSDRHSRIAPAELDALSEAGVGVEWYSDRNPVEIDAFGIEAVPLVRDRYVKQWANLAEEIRTDLKNCQFSDKEFVQFLLQLQERIATVWKGVRQVDHPKRLAVHAVLTKRFSKIRKRQECWLLITLKPIDDDDRDDVFLRQLRNRINPKRRVVSESANMERLAQKVFPHPEADETKFEIENLQPLKSGRNSPVAKLADDKLTNVERSKLYEYTVEDLTGFSKHQYEGTSTEIIEDPLRRMLTHKLEENIMDRVSQGTVVSFDELHRILGDSTRQLRQFHSGPIDIKFRLVPYKFGANTYTKVVVITDLH